MAIADYSEPLTQLLTQGECAWGSVKSGLDYTAMGITEKDIPNLIAMATDNELYELDNEAAEGWAPIHAWRALGQLRAESAIVPLLEQSLEYEDHEGWRDWMLTEFPIVFGRMGSSAIPVLAEVIHDRTKSGWFRIIAVEGLETMVKANPDAESQCVAILQEELAHFAENEPDLNAFIIGVLADLQVMEAVPLMEQAFAAGQVDELLYGDWDEVQVSLGLKSLDELPPKQYRLPGSLMEPEFISVGFATTNHEKQKAKKKAKRKQQSEARRKNRKKK
jgi:hypothetical protein